MILFRGGNFNVSGKAWSPSLQEGVIVEGVFFTDSKALFDSVSWLALLLVRITFTLPTSLFKKLNSASPCV